MTDQRTALDDAQAIRHLVEVMSPDADKIVLVPDNLNTHKPASLYAAFPPEEARRLIDKREIHDTPKHGSGFRSDSSLCPLSAALFLSPRFRLAGRRRQKEEYREARANSRT